VANAMAAIARGGILKQPRLFLPFVIASAPSVIASAAKQSQADVEKTRQTNHEPQAMSHEINLNISPQTLFVVHEGMGAVVSEPGGTAYKEFAPVLTSLAEQGVMVYGKTGSTEKPDNAWFAGFATDSAGRSIAIAVLIEGGQHGSADAAPIARDIIQFCIEEGYIGQSLSKIIQEFDTAGSF